MADKLKCFLLGIAVAFGTIQFVHFTEPKEVPFALYYWNSKENLWNRLQLIHLRAMSPEPQGTLTLPPCPSTYKHVLELETGLSKIVCEDARGRVK